MGTSFIEGTLKRNLSQFAETPKFHGMQSTDEPWILHNLDDTIQLGKELITNLPNIKLLLLEGPLGAGKTSVVKGIAKTLGVIEPITSPTFSLAQHYQTRETPLIHLDLYRLENPKDANQIFFEEEEQATAIGALMVIEWPERLDISLPEAWKLRLQYQIKGGRIAHLFPPCTNKNCST